MWDENMDVTGDEIENAEQRCGQVFGVHWRSTLRSLGNRGD